MLKGFSVKTTKIKKKAKRRKVTNYKEDSDEDDTEWIPGCEEGNRRRKGGLYIYIEILMGNKFDELASHYSI